MEKSQVFSYVSFINHKGVFLVGLHGRAEFTAGAWTGGFVDGDQGAISL